MGQAGEMLRRDLDRFAQSIPGAKIKKRGNVTTVTVPPKDEPFESDKVESDKETDAFLDDYLDSLEEDSPFPPY